MDVFRRLLIVYVWVDMIYVGGCMVSDHIICVGGCVLFALYAISGMYVCVSDCSSMYVCLIVLVCMCV